MTLMFIQFWRPTQQYLYKISKGYLSYATMRNIFKNTVFKCEDIGYLAPTYCV